MLAAVLGVPDSELDPGELSSFIDALQGKLCRVVAAGAQRGEPASAGKSAVSWVADSCQMSRTSAADRLCVGAQLRFLPQVEQALRSGRIGYQAASVVCHLSEQLGEKRDHIDEERWVEWGGRFSIKDLRHLAARARYAWDPEGFDKNTEEDYEQCYLHLSPMGRMYRLDGVLDAEGGAALRAAIDALARPLGAADSRLPKQRRADAVVELAYRALDGGTLPRRSGVRPHVAVVTTIAGLKGELGAAASELQDGTPISSKTVQRLACDGTLSRMLTADSMVVDVGRATRVVSGPQRRGVNARYRTCCGPGCDRHVGMTSVHHLEFWARGGPNNLRQLVPLCYFHHRLVHEGGWRVVKSGEAIRWIPPDRELIRRNRAPGRGWAA